MRYQQNPNYHFNTERYKSKQICIPCRKSFKRRILSDISGSRQEEKEAKCPQCQQATQWIGPKFRAPKSNNLRAWASIGVLHDIGALNFIGWASFKIKIPETKQSLHNTLLLLKAEYEYWISQWVSKEYAPENKMQIQHFSAAIHNINKYLKQKSGKGQDKY